MEEKKNLYEKLSEVQNELKAPKSQKNTFGNYNYRSAEDILEAVKLLLKTNRLSLILSDDLVVLGNNNPISYTETYYDKDLKRENTRTIVNCGERYYIKATATLYDLDSEKTISNTAYAREEETKKGMDGSQITGTASSYARKYALNGLFNIDDTKDADTDEYQKQVKQEVKTMTYADKEASPEKGYTKKDSYSKEILATEKQKEMIENILTDEEFEKTQEKYGINLEKLDIQMASKIISSKKGK